MDMTDIFPSPHPRSLMCNATQRNAEPPSDLGAHAHNAVCLCTIICPSQNNQSSSDNKHFFRPGFQIDETDRTDTLASSEPSAEFPSNKLVSFSPDSNSQYTSFFCQSVETTTRKEKKPKTTDDRSSHREAI